MFLFIKGVISAGLIKLWFDILSIIKKGGENMKKYTSILSILAILMSVTFPAYAATQDRYIHLHFDSDGNLTDTIHETIGPNDDDATHRAVYVVYHILDKNAQTHTLWVSSSYWEKQDNGIWKFTDSWFCGYEAIQAFFDEHTGS